MRKWTAAVWVLAALLALGGCSKKEEPKAQAPAAAQPQMPPSHPPTTGGAAGQASTDPMPMQRQVVVPDEVKSTWKAVVLEIQDKTAGTTTDVTVDVGQTVTQGDLEITVETFLPSFSMGGGTITSKSNDTENPAARLVVKDKGVEIFQGWLFSLYPEAHPFQHDRYGMVLKDFVKNQ